MITLCAMLSLHMGFELEVCYTVLRLGSSTDDKFWQGLYVCKYVWSLKSEVDRYVFMNNKCTSKYMLYYSSYENIEWVVWTGMNSSIAASRVDPFLSSFKLLNEFFWKLNQAASLVWTAAEEGELCSMNSIHLLL